MGRNERASERATAGLPFHRLSDFMRMRAAQHRDEIVGRENRRAESEIRAARDRRLRVFFLPFIGRLSRAGDLTELSLPSMCRESFAPRKETRGSLAAVRVLKRERPTLIIVVLNGTERTAARRAAAKSVTLISG